MTIYVSMAWGLENRVTYKNLSTFFGELELLSWLDLQKDKADHLTWGLFGEFTWKKLVIEY